MQPTSAISATGPAAFGVIAERFRRAGQPEKAVTLCREGLDKFPDHLSARVTLGWSLLDMGEFQEAFDQLKSVLKRAPDNLAAIRGLAELHERGIGLEFESMPDAEVEIDVEPDAALDSPEIGPSEDFDPVMPAFEAAAAPELPQVFNQVEDLDPIFEPELSASEPAASAPHFEIEDVLEAVEPDSMFDLAALTSAAPEPAREPALAASPAALLRKPISAFDRKPLALREDDGEERAGELQEWLSRVRERRFNSVSQLMAG